MTNKLRYIGLDVHKDTIVIAVAEQGTASAKFFKTIPYDLARLVKEIRRLAGAGYVVVCYEAGPTGFGVQRALEKAGFDCRVVAPSLIPVQSGNRVKTDRRDAVKLAHFLRSGDLTPITIPDEEREALRDLERSRDDAKKAERVARSQLGKFLLRHDLRYDATGAWTKKHLDWIRRLDVGPLQVVLDDYLKAVEDATERVERLSTALEEQVLASSLAPLAKGLMTLRGVAMVTAATIAAEVGDFHRFPTAKQFMAFVGLTPSEDSSGGRVRRGGITKCGNRHVRRLLVEATHHYRRKPGVSRELRARQADQPELLQALSWKAQRRLHKRLTSLKARGKPYNQAIIATARELAGFVWAIGRQIPVTS